MCHWIRIVSQLMFKYCYFDFVYCDFDVDHPVVEIQMSIYCHLFLSANVRHRNSTKASLNRSSPGFANYPSQLTVSIMLLPLNISDVL